jgi:hypothetical protein
MLFLYTGRSIAPSAAYSRRANPRLHQPLALLQPHLTSPRRQIMNHDETAYSATRCTCRPSVKVLQTNSSPLSRSELTEAANQKASPTLKNTRVFFALSAKAHA